MGALIIAFLAGVVFAMLVTITAQALGRRMGQKEYLP